MPLSLSLPASLGDGRAPFLFLQAEQLRQLFLTFFFGSGVDIPGDAFSVDLGGIAAFPEVVIDLGDTPGSRLPVFPLDRLESG